MVTAIAQAKRELPAEAAAFTSAQLAIAKAAVSSAQTLAGVNTQDFLRDNRIHIKHGSLFIDSYLVIHPRELAPENEPQLRKKLQLTYSINNPSFYESPDRFATAINLGQLIPISLTAKHSKLVDEVKKYNQQVSTGTDAALTRLDQDKHNPFAAIMRDTIEHPMRDPVGMETLKNGLALYLLMREKLTSLGYLNPLSSYITRAATPDQVLSDLADKIGIDPLAVRDAALKGGVNGVGQLLKLNPAYVADVKKLTDYAATQEFSYNLVEHWHLGRQLLGIEAPIAQKIATGMDARITAKIEEYRNRVRHYYDVPAPVKTEEARIADALTLVEPIQRALMHKLGYEICFTPEYYADDIAHYKGIYGLHRKAANNMRDINGTYRIYFSGRGDLKNSMRTFVHEVAHNLWPDQFNAEDAKKIDAYAASDAAHFKRWATVTDDPAHFHKFEGFLTKYKAADDATKPAIMAETNAWLKHHGVTADGLFPYLRDAHDLQYLIKHANETLHVEGARYAKSGYDSPHERFREVISRFAELKQVELRGDPQLLHFLAPGLDQIWEAHYLPHLKRVYNQTLTAEANHTITRAQTTARIATTTDTPTNTTGTSATATGTPAPTTPTPAAELPKVVERPVTTTEPKVTERPITQSAAALTADNQTPGTQVTSIINDRTLAAMSALNTMGIQTTR